MQPHHFNKSHREVALSLSIHHLYITHIEIIIMMTTISHPGYHYTLYIYNISTDKWTQDLHRYILMFYFFTPLCGNTKTLHQFQMVYMSQDARTELVKAKWVYRY